MKKGFTLAEVLIVIAIIGIISSLTIPSVVSNYRKHELEARFKKAVGDMYRIHNLVKMDLGGKINPHISNLRVYYAKYYRIKENTGNFYGLYGSADPLYKNYTGNNEATPHCLRSAGAFSTKDNLMFSFTNGAGSYTTCISIDTNGHKKAPNRLGYDLFTFVLDNNGNLQPAGAKNMSVAAIGDVSQNNGTTYCSTALGNNTLAGISCAYRAIVDKDYFKNLKY